MKYRLLGSTGLKVSEIGFGGWGIGGNAHGHSYGPSRDEDALRAIAKALEMGCTFFDTADWYGFGHSEELLGEALAGRRAEVVIATAGGKDFSREPMTLNFTESHILAAAEQSLRRLRTDYIDLYMLHNPPFTLIQQNRLFEPLEKLKTQGKIRHYGLAVHDTQEGLMAMKTGHVSAIQVAYNYLRRQAAEELFPQALAEGVAIIASEPLANGFLTGKYTKESVFSVGDIRHQWTLKYQSQLIQQVKEFIKTVAEERISAAQEALRFALAQPAIATVIPGCKTPDQVEENLKTSDLALNA